MVYLFYVQNAYCKPSDQFVSRDKLKEAAMLIVNDCKTQVGATDADIEALKAHKLPASKEGLCMLQCLFNTGKIMENGKLNKEGAIEFFTPGLKGDADKVDKMKQMINLCEKEIGDGSDGCENAKLIIECTVKHGREFGFTFPNHLKPN